MNTKWTIFHNLFGEEVCLFDTLTHTLPYRDSDGDWRVQNYEFSDTIKPYLIIERDLGDRDAFLVNGALYCYRDTKIIQIGNWMFIGNERPSSTNWDHSIPVLFNYLEAIWEEYANYMRQPR